MLRKVRLRISVSLQCFLCLQLLLSLKLLGRDEEAKEISLALFSFMLEFLHLWVVLKLCSYAEEV